MVLLHSFLHLDNVQKLINTQELHRSEIASIQKATQDQLNVLKFNLKSHNTIISDVRVLLKSLTKVSISLISLINIKIKNPKFLQIINFF